MPDNFCIVEKSVVKIYNIVYCKTNGLHTIIGKKYLTITYIYNKPCISSYISCFYVENESNTFLVFPVSKISAKCLSIPRGNGFAVFPILHN